ncbi:MAG: zinc ribbon domain-containing protein [Spirochaetia bacterium]|jgi:putative FmdB family regulatory protein|nr:zinc ribbon domain-containing protein [Spirochaetia bacterium]
MPTYDYKCEQCERTFEYFQSMSDDSLTVCQECKGPLKRLIGGGLGIIFKGSGFYVTDNKSKNSNSSAAKDNSPDKSGKSESDSPKKTETKKEPVKST